MMSFVPRATCRAVGALVATVVALTLPSVALAATPSNRGTAATTVSRTSKKPASSTTTTTSAVPAAAEPLLKRLLATAGVVTEENQKASSLSESYDMATYKLARSEADVALPNGRVRVADLRLSGARSRLRQAAVLAYVTGELDELNSGLLSGNVSDGEMANVYS